MSSHTAKITWERGEQLFSDGKYARKHNISFDGGISFAGAPNEAIKPPLGAIDAVDPEELLVAALSSCHMMWFLDFARKAGFVVNSYNDDPIATMEKTPAGKVAITKITLCPKVAFEGNAPDDATYDALHHHAHEVCNIANSIKAEIEIAKC
jgi:organic hydroperoxide reductase OsmC/OhrA